MNPPDCTPTPACREQVYLIERDAGLLCRILGLYAARALDIQQVDYAYAANDVMKLSVRTDSRRSEAGHHADTLRVLVAKIATLVGVIAASEKIEHPAWRTETADV